MGWPPGSLERVGDGRCGKRYWSRGSCRWKTGEEQTLTQCVHCARRIGCLSSFRMVAAAPARVLRLSVLLVGRQVALVRTMALVAMTLTHRCWGETRIPVCSVVSACGTPSVCTLQIPPILCRRPLPLCLCGRRPTHPASLSAVGVTTTGSREQRRLLPEPSVAVWPRAAPVMRSRGHRRLVRGVVGRRARFTMPLPACPVSAAIAALLPSLIE